ncbi:DUF1499 domain-containing protein [Thermodesulfobacteriota bacterium]
MPRLDRSFINALVVMILTAGCSGKRPESFGFHNPGLADCPETPNCVSTEAEKKSQKIEPFRLKGDPKVIWPKVIEIANSIPRATIVETTHNYVHLEYRSLIFRFVDDLEMLLDPVDGSISIRSAARLGKSDFGVNRKRVELLRRMMKDKDLIE